jgi:hypothetical protein
MMGSIRKIVIAALLVVGLVSMAPEALAKKEPPMTPLQLQALQSREFETSKDNLFNAVMTVVQDLGYQVQSADLQTGFITAVSATEQKTNFFEALGGGSSTANTRLTAFVQNMPNGMARVRLNFLISKTSQSIYGQSNQKDKPVLDASVYNNAWDKIDEALFVMGALVSTQSPVKPPDSPQPKEPGLITIPSSQR